MISYAFVGIVFFILEIWILNAVITTVAITTAASRRTPSDNPTESLVIVISAAWWLNICNGEDESVVEMNFAAGWDQEMEENGINQEFMISL